MPDDPFIIDMDPVQKLWMYSNWQEDQNDDAELAKNHAYLLASFWNPEAVQDILGNGNVHTSSNEEFEESSNIVKNGSLQMLESIKEEESVNSNRRRRRRRKIIKQD